MKIRTSCSTTLMHMLRTNLMILNSLWKEYQLGVSDQGRNLERGKYNLLLFNNIRISLCKARLKINHKPKILRTPNKFPTIPNKVQQQTL
jgi:hypothetical protein